MLNGQGPNKYRLELRDPQWSQTIGIQPQGPYDPFPRPK